MPRLCNRGTETRQDEATPSATDAAISLDDDDDDDDDDDIDRESERRANSLDREPFQPALSRRSSRALLLENSDDKSEKTNKAALKGVALVRRMSKTFKTVEAVEAFKAAESFKAAEIEMKHSWFQKDHNPDATVGWWDIWMYHLENAISANPTVPFLILFAASFVIIVILAVGWDYAVEEGEDGVERPHGDLAGAAFLTFQVLISGGYDQTITHLDERIIYASMIIAGVFVVSILIGLITETITDYLHGFNEGSSKVCEKGHTLILGWNEATPRVIRQIAFLRRTWMKQNERWDRRLFPWLRVPPSTPVAEKPVVILYDGKSKQQMEEIVKHTFAEKNLKQQRTKIGRDVIFRVGDPTKTQDLVRVAAHEATSILIMMTDVDEEETKENNFKNSATLRCLLSVRNIIYSKGLAKPGGMEASWNPKLRVVVQLRAACDFIDAANFTSPTGTPCVHSQDLTVYLNTVLFRCASQPGLSRVLSNIIDVSYLAVGSL
jgi:hypothetical protein